MDIQERATLALTFFETKEMGNERGDVWFRTDKAPEWVTDLCFHAHGQDGPLPDDWRYEFIVDALVTLSEDASDAPQLEPTVYTAKLTAWLGSLTWRHEYVNEARADWGSAENIIDDISRGMLREMEEVHGLVFQWLDDDDNAEHFEVAA